MAALTITAASVTLVSGRPLVGTLLGTVTRGMPLYADGTAGLFGINLGASDSNTSGKKSCAGIALTDGAVGQPVCYAGTAGDVIGYGAIFAANGIYIVGAAIAGDICISTELTTGWDLVIIGVAKTTSQLTLFPFASGVSS